MTGGGEQEEAGRTLSEELWEKVRARGDDAAAERHGYGHGQPLEAQRGPGQALSPIPIPQRQTPRRREEATHGQGKAALASSSLWKADEMDMASYPSRASSSSEISYSAADHPS
jgi:hypothetical protein